ncbi:glycosyltransferase [Streptomyces sp. NPDC052496]|uniref:glycosyltransferase n=1 Tax=Streptomyces sp. NPDC052496 TaxID=3154951 RepID=UPI00341AE639
MNHSLPPAPPTALVVAVPAHDEAATLPSVLRALHTATRHPRLRAQDLPVVTVVAADACSDGTAALARRYGAHVVQLARRNVGAARAAAVAHGLDLLGSAAEHAWIATTDADTLVPADWLAYQIQQATAGWDCVLGTIRIAPHPTLSTTIAQHHHTRYFAGRPEHSHTWNHPHVHGANLGVAAPAYHRAHGFPALTHSEDHALVAALQRTGARILSTDDCPVLTSGRTTPRAPHGFGAYLHNLRPTPVPAALSTPSPAPVPVPSPAPGSPRRSRPHDATESVTCAK